MCLVCAAGGLTQTIVSALVQIYKRDETFNANEIANGVLGCLVAITGCCPFIDPPWALLIGGILPEAKPHSQVALPIATWEQSLGMGLV